MTDINLNEIKEKVQPILKRANITKAALFGSQVRGDAKENSDIDILVDIPRGTTLLDLVGIKQDLEDILKKNVDLVTYNSIHPKLKEFILSNQYPIL